MRIGSVGVLLRFFHSPLAGLETFRALQLLSLGRVDLGIARSSKIAQLQRLAKPLDQADPLFGYIEPRAAEFADPELWVLSTSYEGAKIAEAPRTLRWDLDDERRITTGTESEQRDTQD